MISRRGFLSGLFGTAAAGTVAAARSSDICPAVAERVREVNGSARAIAYTEPKRKPVIIGRRLVFGIPDVIKPIPMVIRAGARVRFVFRPTRFARVYVRENGMTTEWHIEDKGAYWEPTIPGGCNSH